MLVLMSRSTGTSARWFEAWSGGSQQESRYGAVPVVLVGFSRVMERSVLRFSHIHGQWSLVHGVLGRHTVSK